MYTKRIQLLNYGPIEKLDIEFPFHDETPKPVVLVGENGSGKSILLSHIVNGLLTAKGVAYPETPEVDVGKVYKLRSSSYIKSGYEYYFGRVDFEGSFFVSEIRTQKDKQEYSDAPVGMTGSAAQPLWEKLSPHENDRYDTNIKRRGNTPKEIETVFGKNCVLYLPHNRFEEPAWLNEDNLKAQAEYMDLKHMQGHSERPIIALSPLHDNKNWLFDLLYDRAVLEIQTRNMNLPVANSVATVPLPVFLGYSGTASATYEVALQIVRGIVSDPNVRFGIGTRKNRVISVLSETGSITKPIVPNIFQLSSGETSLLNLFLSILRDFDLCGTPFSNAADIRGIVVIDEIDLHLHAVHQHEVLPMLMKMFPKVQFIVTTNSPLFVLGMKKVFGEDGIALYRLPQGRQVSPEEFSEFEVAYSAFTETRKFSDDVRAAIENSQKPIVFVEGTTDIKYIRKASELLGFEAIIDAIEIRDGDGADNLKKIWKTSKHIDVINQKTVLLYDCDTGKTDEEHGNLFQRVLPFQRENPIKVGIENLFNETTLQEAIAHKQAFVDIEREHPSTKRGVEILVPEKWTINENEKTNLCNWICENGNREDFEAFELVFAILREVVDLQTEIPSLTGAIEQKSNGAYECAEEVKNLEPSQ